MTLARSAPRLALIPADRIGLIRIMYCCVLFSLMLDVYSMKPRHREYHDE